ncbi:MAG: hypothetical protein AAFY73_09540, partial [Pseudomonadota bacterium]
QSGERDGQARSRQRRRLSCLKQQPKSKPASAGFFFSSRPACKPAKRFPPVQSKTDHIFFVQPDIGTDIGVSQKETDMSATVFALFMMGCTDDLTGVSSDR